MIDFSKVINVKTPEGTLKKVEFNNSILWEKPYIYSSFGDSIAAGHTINSDWEKDYGTDSSYTSWKPYSYAGKREEKIPAC